MLVLVAVTFAPAMTAPAVSVTLPEMAPVTLGLKRAGASQPGKREDGETFLQSLEKLHSNLAESQEFLGPRRACTACSNFVKFHKDVGSVA